MMIKYHDLLPLYLEGDNIRAHGEIIDRENNKLRKRISTYENVLHTYRPILFIDEYSVLIEVDGWIKTITLTLEDSSTETIEKPLVDGKRTGTLTVSQSLKIVSVEVEDENNIVYTKSFEDVDDTIDTLGKLLMLQRFKNETDYEYMQRIKYLCENKGNMITALIYARLVFNDMNIELNLFRELYEKNPQDWTEDEAKRYMTAYVYKLDKGDEPLINEVGDFIRRFTPLTREVIFRGVDQAVPYINQSLRVYPAEIGGVRDEDGVNRNGIECDITFYYHDGTSRTFTVTTTPHGKLQVAPTNMFLSTDVIKIVTKGTQFLKSGTVRQDVVVAPSYMNMNVWEWYRKHIIYKTYNFSLVNRPYYTVTPSNFNGNKLWVRTGQLWRYSQNFYPLRDSFVLMVHGESEVFSWFVNEEVITLPEQYPGMVEYPSQMKAHWLFKQHHFSSTERETAYFVFKNEVCYYIIKDDNGDLYVDSTWDTSNLPAQNMYYVMGCMNDDDSFSFVNLGISRDISQFEELLQDPPEFDVPTVYEVYYGETVTITGKLLKGETGVSGATVELLKNDTSIRSATTDNTGAFTIEYPTTSMDYGLPFKLRYTRTIGAPITQNIEITLIKHDVYLTVPSITATVGDIVDLEVTLIDENNNNVTTGNVEVTLEKIENGE